MILVSAGHNNNAKGACFEGLCEYPLTLIWAKNIVRLINENGIYSEVVPVTSLKNKVKYINNLNSILAVEIHFNSDQQRRGHGSETLYYPNSEKGVLAANLIQANLSRIGYDRGAKEGWYRMDPERGPDYFLAKTQCTSLIIEPEFIHNMRQATHRFQHVACDVITQALIAAERKLRVD